MGRAGVLWFVCVFITSDSSGEQVSPKAFDVLLSWISANFILSGPRGGARGGSPSLSPRGCLGGTLGWGKSVPVPLTPQGHRELLHPPYLCQAGAGLGAPSLSGLRLCPSPADLREAALSLSPFYLEMSAWAPSPSDFGRAGVCSVPLSFEGAFAGSVPSHPHALTGQPLETPALKKTPPPFLRFPGCQILKMHVRNKAQSLKFWRFIRKGNWGQVRNYLTKQSAALSALPLKKVQLRANLRASSYRF